MKRWLWTLSAVALLASRPAFARECAGVSLPDRLTVDDRELVLNGVGLREATLLRIDVYVGGLYLERPSGDGDGIAASEQVKQIRLRFVRDVDRENVAATFQAAFERSAGKDFARLKPRVADFASRLPEMKSGDTLILTYRPGQGVEIATQAGARGTIPGADFGRALFGIWLGERPADEDLKAGLLGGNCE